MLSLAVMPQKRSITVLIALGAAVFHGPNGEIREKNHQTGVTLAAPPVTFHSYTTYTKPQKTGPLPEKHRSIKNYEPSKTTQARRI